ncbi:putative chrysanthemyl diphosphate synthase [Helianthus debilis subsp. tardiflorus]
MYAGKMIRGLAVLQAYLLVHDDIIDGSHTRRGHPCWFRLPEVVCMVAVNDALVLRKHVPRILKKHFSGKAYDVTLIELFSKTEFQTISGQMIDAVGPSRRIENKPRPCYTNPLASAESKLGGKPGRCKYKHKHTGSPINTTCINANEGFGYKHNVYKCNM